MIKQMLGHLKAWILGEDVELHIDKTWSFTWFELIPIVATIGLIAYLIWR